MERMRTVLLKEEAISVGEDEEPVQLTAKLLTSVDTVSVIAPPDRQDDFCCIYGNISVTDNLSKPAVTLFSRSRDNPQILNLGRPYFSFLDLTHHASDRSLDGWSENHFTIHLSEKKNVKIKDLRKERDGEEVDESSDPDGYQSSDRDWEEEDESADPDGEEDDQRRSEEEDPDQSLGHTGGDELIACTKPFQGNFDLTSSFVISGNYGFKFEVSYADIFGARVQVEVKINRDIELTETGQVLDPSCSTKRIVKTICGCIEAYQNLGTPRDEAMLTLYRASRFKPTPVLVGEPIPLHRNIVVAPVEGGLLTIRLALWNGDRDSVVADELVRFAILPIHGSQRIFLTNKQRTHNKEVLDGLISVSIIFLD